MRGVRHRKAVVGDLHRAEDGLGLAEAATSVMPACRVKAEAVLRARQGKLLQPEDFEELPAAEGGGPGAWLSPEGELIAIGSTSGELRVVRGFNSEP